MLSLPAKDDSRPGGERRSMRRNLGIRRHEGEDAASLESARRVWRRVVLHWNRAPHEAVARLPRREAHARRYGELRDSAGLRDARQFPADDGRLPALSPYHSN